MPRSRVNGRAFAKSSSTSTPTTSAPSGLSRAARATKPGISIRQGPHHVAQKSSSSALPANVRRATDRPSRSRSVKFRLALGAEAGQMVPPSAVRATNGGVIVRIASIASIASIAPIANVATATSRTVDFATHVPSQRVMLFHPAEEIGLDERFRPRAPGEPERERSALARQAEVEVKEQATEPLRDDPLGHERDRRAVAWELEFVPVGQLLDAEFVLSERAGDDVFARSRAQTRRQGVAQI